MKLLETKPTYNNFDDKNNIILKSFDFEMVGRIKHGI